MRVLGLNRDHDGGLCLLHDGKLAFALQAEKDTHLRHQQWTDSMLRAALERMGGQIPDVVAEGGWFEREGGYFGTEEGRVTSRTVDFLGCEVPCFASSHERGHVMCAYGLSPFEQGRPCYALVWEGSIGAFYSIDERVRIMKICDVMDQPGHRYAFLFELADQSFPEKSRGYTFASAGKLMALAAYAERRAANGRESEALRQIFEELGKTRASKGDFAGTPYHDVGHGSQAFRNLAGQLSDALFERFLAVARKELRERLAPVDRWWLRAEL
jgi:hydroxymethyl cephem carbamoyltransferase